MLYYIVLYSQNNNLVIFQLLDFLNKIFIGNEHVIDCNMSHSGIHFHWLAQLIDDSLEFSDLC